MTDIIQLIKTSLEEGKITEAEVLDVVNTITINDEDEKATRVVHSVYCKEKHDGSEGSCKFYEEESMPFPYSREAHKKWYKEMLNIKMEFNLLSSTYIIDGISKATHIMAKIEDIRGGQGILVYSMVRAFADSLIEKHKALIIKEKEKSLPQEQGELFSDPLSMSPL